MKKIAVTTTSFGTYDEQVLAPLKQKGFEIALNPHGRTLKDSEVDDVCRDAVGMIAGTEKLSAQTLKKLTALKVISRCGAGMDNVDIHAAEKMGIKVFNTPDAPTLAVAELTMGLILSLLRKTTQMDREIRGGAWKKRMGNLLCGKKTGIVGFGRIGQKVGSLLQSFGAETGYYDVYAQKTPLQSTAMSMDDLLPWADIVTLHCTAQKDGRFVLGERELQRMKKGAWLVNAARGGLVDERALCAALESGHLSGAALDVFEKEPYSGRLAELDNVILTPHIGSYAKESRIEMERQSVENLLKGLG